MEMLAGVCKAGRVQQRKGDSKVVHQGRHRREPGMGEEF